MRYPLNSSTSVSPSSGRLKTLRCSTKLAKKDKIDKIVNNVVLQILQITHLPGRLERPEYECRPPCSTPQKQKVTEHVSCEGYSRVSGRWVRARRGRVAALVQSDVAVVSRGSPPAPGARALTMYTMYTYSVPESGAGALCRRAPPRCWTVLLRVMLSLYSVVYHVIFRAYISAYKLNSIKIILQNITNKIRYFLLKILTKKY